MPTREWLYDFHILHAQYPVISKLEEKLASVEAGPGAACHNCVGTCHWSMMRKLRHLGGEQVMRVEPS